MPDPFAHFRSVMRCFDSNFSFMKDLVVESKKGGRIILVDLKPGFIFIDNAAEFVEKPIKNCSFR